MIWTIDGKLTLTQCQNACADGESAREAFCGKIPSTHGMNVGAAKNEVKAKCWSHVYESTTACKNWCAWWF
ncbi:unnamed protein product [Rotaria sordida]|uniref:Uncharacterized protein n=1 Tax=Rotaria sordida TaxID=392033 RepID=A0A815II42_9BILA|nr:unnamed protein product [Rotaria sordida]CAF1343505.1 unnamed protein product [Rotaria sordida]CAF1366275.1 unnamed protein product [Rotaria sordida]CAF1366363.1 unnamed protein product [Rotaria sordida]CAF1412642.1 unnamed protein product [Rotaria sordida]